MAQLAQHSMTASQEGVLTMCCAAAASLPYTGISQELGWCRSWSRWEQLAKENQRVRKVVCIS